MSNQEAAEGWEAGSKKRHRRIIDRKGLQQQMMRNQQDKPASFIGKLCNILRSKEYAKVICWDCEHKGIRVLNQKKLEESVLPRYYRHNRFASFVRQLNMYDFHKVHLGDHKSIFLHSEFDPRKKENIHLIRRKIIAVEPSELDKENEPQPEPTDLPISPKVSMRRMSFRNSICMVSEKNQSESESAEQVTHEILAMLLPESPTLETVKAKIAQLRKIKKFRRFLKSSSFLQKIYTALGLEIDSIDDQLSELSIDLLFDTRKSFTSRSLKMLESGPLYFKDTYGFLNN